MTTQNSKNQVLISSPEVKVDKLVSNLLLANLIGQFKSIIDSQYKRYNDYCTMGNHM